MKKVNSKNKKIIVSITFIFIIIISVVAYNYYQQQELQKKIDNAISQIEKTEKDFTTKDSRDDKLTLLQSLVKGHEEYEKSKNMINEVDKEYHVAISNMQKMFIDDYNKTISENTLKDVETINDKSQLENAKTNLNDLLIIIQNEKGVVCSEKEIKEYESSINVLIKSYDDKLSAIAQEEQQAEEARKEKESSTINQPQGNANQSNNSSFSNGSASIGNDSNNSGSSGNSSSLPWNYGYRWAINGETGVRTWINPQTNDVYDDNGNWLFNIASPIR